MTITSEEKVFTAGEILDFAIEYIDDSRFFDNSDFHEIKMDLICSLLIDMKVVANIDEIKDIVNVCETTKR